MNTFPNYANIPIMRAPIWNGRLDGDDTGYETVQVSQLDLEDPDPLVPMNGLLACYRVYAEGHGNQPRLTSNYGRGYEGFSDLMLCRKPAFNLLLEWDSMLRSRHRLAPRFIDARREYEAQTAMWRRIFYRLQGARPFNNLSVEEIITLGRQAKVIALYVPVVKNDAYGRFVRRLRTSGRWAQVHAAAQSLNLSLDSVIYEFVTLLKNLGMVNTHMLAFDEESDTAHIAGGAFDVYPTFANTGEYLCFGVPYDYIVKDPSIRINPCRIDFFEDDGNLEPYRELQAKDPELGEYLHQCGVDNPCLIDDWRRIRDLRRIIYGTAMELEMTFYEEEPWHWQAHNLLGGKQVSRLPGNGNVCHALLRDRRDPATHEITAVWGGKAANRLARAIG